MTLPTVDIQALTADGEFQIAARHWTGGVRIVCDDESIAVTIADGIPVSEPPAPDATGVIELSGSGDVWTRVLSAVPPPFYNDVSAALEHGLRRRCDPLVWWQYLPAVQRFVEILRSSASDGLSPIRGSAPGTFDAPVGRYVHLVVDGLDHRIYFEEAGRGIPVLLQHTAGSNGIQWRHLMERSDITEHFRLIAYDLPFHGKSLPPDGRAWWTDRYRLTGATLRAVPLAIAEALDLVRPVFMGCSVGGLLALDLALHHPDRFQAVISLEGALHIGGDPTQFIGFWHPGVSNDAKAKMMEGLMSPSAPIERRKETAFAYASGWPAAFMGDLHYYMAEFDLRASADRINTDDVAVHIMSGEYDHSATVEMGRRAHEAIAGSTFIEMHGLGHFPMSEDPERFAQYLLPVLDRIRRRGQVIS